MDPLLLVCVLASALMACGGWLYARYIRPARAWRDMVATLTARVRELEQERRDESFHLHTILDRLTEGVLIVDGAQKIRLVNPGLRAMFDFSASPLNRTPLEAFRHHAIHATVRAALAGDQPQARTVTLEVRQENGRYVEKHFHLTATSLAPGGGAIAIFHDVTQLKALEAVRRDFVANVSHELRTPLSILNGYLETLLEPEGLRDETAVRRFLGVMWKHGQRLQHLLEDLLTLARLESNGTQPGKNHGAAAAAQDGDGVPPKPLVDLRAVLVGVVERLAPVIAQKSASVQTEFAADLPFIAADAGQLDQVFFNLLDNALKYGERTTAGGGGAVAAPLTMRLVARRVPASAEPAAESVEILVTDNGPGIPLADQPHLFERFYRVHKDRSRDAGGTGLGLAIVKHIVQAHGGQVSVESQPGAGATFRVCLPSQT
ncbi:MAG: PAS-domain containing protein [Verrucomicrobia bacterium]|nr:PAS-domain containing protein [Verrucomicrobiota bacterium]